MASPALLALAAALASQGEGLVVEPAITTWLEVDTNANRVPVGVLGGDADPGKLRPPGDDVERPSFDALARADAALDVAYSAPGLRLSAESAAGVKLFVEEEQERLVVAQSRASLVTARLPAELVLSLSAFGKARAQRSGRRTYAIARGDATLERALFGVAWRIGLEGQAFEALDDARFSFAGGGLVLGARAPLGDGERLDVVVDVAGRGFPFAARDLDNPDSRPRRTDGASTLSLHVTSARRLFLSAGYALVRNDSNARGESWLRHRVQALVGFRLPGSLTVGAVGSAQLTSYDDGVSLGQAYFLGDEDETQNMLELTLSKPVLGGISLEARGALFGNELASEGARFSRQTAAIGVRVEL
ncbi:MAG: hypothetical protein HYS27_05735 [Deltaproteobacteria bacterium]|nr:hypothetical protein [Deltaproteobacteria bacterium]